MYLFEPDIKWATPLKLTLAPWKDKVEIIQKYVSDKSTKDSVSLDDFFAGKYEEINYIQTDIEGAEKKMLLGGDRLLEKAKKIKLSICSYHNQSDQIELSDILSKKGFNVDYSHGYIIMWMQLPCNEPYLRKGVIYAYKIK